jgi:asparagine synthase (glutamine-hydrolysing)
VSLRARAADCGDHDVAGAVPWPRSPRAFLAISYATEAQRAAQYPDAPGSQQRVRTAAAMVTDQQPVTAGGTRVWLSAPPPLRADVEGGFTLVLSRVPDSAGLARELGERLAAGHARPDARASRPLALAVNPAAAGLLATLSPPFGFISCAGPGEPVVAGTDIMGCRQLYWIQGQGWAGVSTSLLALARCAAAQPDRDSLAVSCMLGFHLGSSTAFAGISKLAPGSACALLDGKVEVSRYANPWPRAARPAGSRELIDSAAELLRAQGEMFVDSFPGAVIELSGGLDSRIQVAAIPPARRAGLRAVTLDQPGSEDGAIATRVAAVAGLDHQLVPLADLTQLTPAAAWDLARAAAIRGDCCTNPVSHAVLDWAEEQLGSNPRIHGAGGEAARGYYYLGQRQHPAVTPALVTRLARWRLMTNEAVDAGCLGADLAKSAREITTRRVHDILAGYQCDWLSATDEFYVRERVVRWAGARLSASSTERTLLSSFLDPEFVLQARACPPELKRNSRFMSAVLAKLDPELARMPLDTGYVPADLADRGLLSRARTYPVTGKKYAHKIGQRLRRSRRPGVGQPVLASLVVEHWRSEPQLLADVPATGMADGDWIGRLLRGECAADPATVGHLSNLVVMTEVMTQPAGERSGAELATS